MSRNCVRDSMAVAREYIKWPIAARGWITPHNQVMAVHVFQDGYARQAVFPVKVFHRHNNIMHIMPRDRHLFCLWYDLLGSRRKRIMFTIRAKDLRHPGDSSDQLIRNESVRDCDGLVCGTAVFSDDGQSVSRIPHDNHLIVSGDNPLTSARYFPI